MSDKKTILFWMSIGLTLILFSLEVIRYVCPSFGGIPQLINVYIALLAAFVGVKEIARWVLAHTNRTELAAFGFGFIDYLFILWAGTLIIMVVFQIIFQWFGWYLGQFQTPAEMFDIVLKLTPVFLAGKTSEGYRQYKLAQTVQKENAK